MIRNSGNLELRVILVCPLMVTLEMITGSPFPASVMSRPRGRLAERFEGRWAWASRPDGSEFQARQHHPPSASSVAPASTVALCLCRWGKADRRQRLRHMKFVAERRMGSYTFDRRVAAVLSCEGGDAGIASRVRSTASRSSGHIRDLQEEGCDEAHQPRCA
jgi:hypothetical protein